MGLRIGLTGGIASGKSTVGRMFSALGVPRIDADQVARDVVQPGTVGLARVAANFGHEVLNADGSLNRSLLRQQVFADPDARKRLEAITHPLIHQAILRWLARAGGPYVILESPLLLETGQDRWVNRVLVVDIPEALQLQRLCQRDDMHPDQAALIIAAQCPAQARRERADDLLSNHDSREALQAQVRALHEAYLRLAQA